MANGRRSRTLMQYDTDELNLIWDKDLSTFCLLDSNYNMIQMDLEKEKVLHKLISNLVQDDIIDHSLIGDEVDDIYLFLIEKIYATTNPTNHSIYKFSKTLNQKTKMKIITAFNVFLNGVMQTKTNSRIVAQYET